MELEGDAFGTNSPNIAAIDMPLRMAGQYADRETGLFYNYFRFYDPNTGRYVTSDPIGLEGGMNTYGYVGGNPLHLLDRLGLKYTPENCELLAIWISEQWKMFWVYFDRSISGKVTTRTQAITHTASGCSIYPDEGRRLSCEAHEKAHRFSDHIYMLMYALSLITYAKIKRAILKVTPT